MTLVDGQRGEDGEDLAVEDVVEVGAVVVVEGVPVRHDHAGVGSRAGATCSEKIALCRSTSSVDPVGDGAQLLVRAQPVRRPGPEPGGHLVLEPGHPDLEELVQPLGEDGQELHPLEQGDAIVRGQLEQAGRRTPARTARD